MKLVTRRIVSSLAVVAVLAGAALAVEHKCEAAAGQTCTAKNLDTGVTTTFQRGERLVITSGNWQLSNNWSSPT